MAREKKTTKEINFRKLTKNTTWVSIIVIVLVAICIYVIMFIAAAAFGGYLINSKLDSEIDSSEHMADIFRSKDISEEKAYELLDREGRDYYIIDTETDEVIHSVGDVERFTDDQLISDDLLSAGDIKLYSNANAGFFFFF